MSNYSTLILNIAGSMSPTSDNALGFCQPMFEDIFLFSCELAASVERPPYYGDEIDLGFWRLLNLKFGSPTVSVDIVCIGGSLTAGYGGGGINWVSEWSDIAGFNLINAGVINDTSSDMVLRFNSDVIAIQPKYCIIEVGLGDALNNIPIQTCKDNISTMVNLCLSNNIEPRFVHYIERYNQLELALYNGSYSYNTNYIMDYLKIIWQYEQSLNYPALLFNDVSDIDQNNANMTFFYNTANDYIHPNASGYAEWAGYVAMEFMDISSSNTSGNGVYGLHQDWKYQYYHTIKKFVIKDENGSIVLEKYDVNNICKFPIDFEVVNSHQFEIIIGDSSEVSSFLLNAILKKKVFGESPILYNGFVPVVNNVYLPNSEKNGTPKVVVIGSGLTSGYPYTIDKPGEVDDTVSWTAMFRDRTKYRVINNSASGDTSFDMLNRFTQDVLDLHPEYCIMELCINDYLYGGLAYLSQSKDNINTMISLCLSNNIEPRFIIAVPRLNQSDYDLNINIQEWHDYQLGIQNYISSLGYTAIPYYEALDYEDGVVALSLTYDYIHPNEEGHKRIGKLVVAYIDDLGGFNNFFNTELQRFEPSEGDSYIEHYIYPRWDIVNHSRIIRGLCISSTSDLREHLVPTQQRYADEFKPFYAIKSPVTFRTMMLNYARWVVPLLGLTMFPMLETILRNGETQNNRPIYEPWLIWGVFKFLCNHKGPYYPWDDDEEAPDIDVLDGISPNWSYG